jgi:ribosomal protein S18 acetylase RimI-like enzyme
VISLGQAKTPEDISSARQLFKEYEAGLGISLCFQNFDQEVAGLPGDYAPPTGRLFLAYADDQLAGCIALRKLESTTCEMKRLFIRPEFRGLGLGKRLVDEIIKSAREAGYDSMRLDTMPGRMDTAINLYRAFGFQETSPYCHNPVDGAIFMELKL